MKESALKSSPLSLVPPATGRAKTPRENSALSLENYFDGWVTSVNPTAVGTKTTDEKPRRRYGRRPLTTKDVVRVNRATLRESFAHRYWPREVILTFLAADVITDK